MRALPAVLVVVAACSNSIPGGPRSRGEGAAATAASSSAGERTAATGTPLPVDDEAEVRFSALLRDFPGGRRVVPLVRRTEATGFVATPDGTLAPDVPATERVARLRPLPPTEVRLPLRADAPFTLAHAGVTLRVRLVGAAGVPAAVAHGALVYAHALPGGDLFHVPLARGTEEYVRFDARPARPELRYEVEPGGAAAGLRLVAGVLEVIAADGTPRLHTTAPRVFDAHGREVEGTLAVEGCRVDADPSAPWGRPPVAPGASTCTVVAAWDDLTLEYPILVDPTWADTGAMAQERYKHTAALLLGNGLVLVAGGTQGGANPLKTAELYHWDTGSWAATSSMATARCEHAMFGWKTPPNQTPASGAVVAGGSTSGTCDPPAAGTATSTTERYSTTLGTWTAGNALPGGARWGLAATFVIRANSIPSPPFFTYSVWGIVTGGYNGTSYSAASDYVDPTGAGLAWATGPVLATARAKHSTAAWDIEGPDGGFVVAGGRNSSGVLSSVEFLNTGPSGTWVSGGSLTGARYSLAAAGPLTTITQSNDTVLFAGGYSSSGAGATTIDAFDIASKTTTKLGVLSAGRGLLAGARWNGPDLAMFAGGSANDPDLVGGSPSANHPSSSADLVELGTGLVFTQSMSHSRMALTLTTLSTGKLLAAGGLDLSTLVPHDEVLQAAAVVGDPCSGEFDCANRQCVDGYCCGSACSGQCEACNQSGSEGTCLPVTGAPVGSRAACPSYGTPCGAACDGVTTTACTYASTSTVCSAPSCTAQIETLAGTCNGAGSCLPASLRACKPYFACDAAGTACVTTCTVPADCTSGFCAAGTCCQTACTEPCQRCGLDGICVSCPTDEYCAADTCVPKLAQGTSCTGPTECQSGNCVDGVCCDQPCAGNCEHCTAAGACVPVDDGTDPRLRCQASSGGTAACAGTCHGGQCVFPDVGTVCGRCAACDGTGRCTAVPDDDPSCGVVQCGGLSTGCRTYHDLTASRCASLGLCKADDDPATCTAYDDLSCDDAGRPDGGASSDAATPGGAPGSCGCRTGGATAGGGAVAILAALALALARPRRRRAARPTARSARSAPRGPVPPSRPGRPG